MPETWIPVVRRPLAVAMLVVGACRGLQPLPPAPEPLPSSPRPASTPTPGDAGLPDDAEALLARDLVIPVRGVLPERLRDTYTARRGDRIHAALDIMAPRGTPVLAADGGLLWKVRSNALGGRTIYVLDDAQRFIYYYAHLDRYAEGIREGDRVEKGAVIGYVGTTGNAPPDAPHLHFQVMKYRGNGRWWDGDPINPYPVLTRLPGGSR